jgi:hypothetical protein
MPLSFNGCYGSDQGDEVEGVLTVSRRLRESFCGGGQSEACPPYICLRRHSGARVKRANPESIGPQEYWEKWIPGLRLAAHPGMTI